MSGRRIHRWINTGLFLVAILIGIANFAIHEHDLTDCEDRLFNHLTKDSK